MSCDCEGQETWRCSWVCCGPLKLQAQALPGHGGGALSLFPQERQSERFSAYGLTSNCSARPLGTECLTMCIAVCSCEKDNKGSVNIFFTVNKKFQKLWEKRNKNVGVYYLSEFFKLSLVGLWLDEEEWFPPPLPPPPLWPNLYSSLESIVMFFGISTAERKWIQSLYEDTFPQVGQALFIFTFKFENERRKKDAHGLLWHP